MRGMFLFAQEFNQDIGWAVHSVTDMGAMFNNAYAFDQDLGWCVDDNVHLGYAFAKHSVRIRLEVVRRRAARNLRSVS